MSATEVLDTTFLETRFRLIEVAALLDRIDRCREPEAGRADFRYGALKEAISILANGTESRARAILTALSDPTPEPLEKAGSKGATGAYKGARR